MREEIKTIKIYQFDELEKAVQENIINHWNDQEQFDSEYTIDYFIGLFKEKYNIKIDSKNVFYSGFWSQGDGACFDFNLDNQEILDYLKKTKQLTKYKKLVDFMKDNDVKIYTVKNSYYSNEKTRYTEFDYNSNCNIYGKREQTIIDLLEDLKNEIESIRLEKSIKLYRMLEAGYNYWNSAEYIKENIIDNRYEFTAGGEIY